MVESYTQDLKSVVLYLKLNKPIIFWFQWVVILHLGQRERVNYRALILANTVTNSDNEKAKLKRAAGISDIDAKYKNLLY